VHIVLEIIGYTFDGYSKGQMTVCVPQGWKVIAQCTMKTAVPHSCAVVENSTATSTAFPGAGIKDLVGGLQPGDSESFTFTPDRTGQFRIACLVRGYEEHGMWDYFDVISTGDPLIAS
jgi:hypothetical protein